MREASEGLSQRFSETQEMDQLLSPNVERERGPDSGLGAVPSPSIILTMMYGENQERHKYSFKTGIDFHNM